MTGATPRSGTRLFLDSFQTMYFACRADYPCEGCEMGRIASFRAALAWARRQTR